MKQQKQVFLETEGDAWVSRNLPAVSARKLPDDDPLLMEIVTLPLARDARVLEIGCGEGARLAWLRQNRGIECHGIEPSLKGVELARARDVQAVQGTADMVPYEDGFFDLVIFGFCLCLCDSGDLFRIAQEADRVLKTPGWLAILDFFPPSGQLHVSRPYHHAAGVKSHKMDYRSMFTWHPSYACVTHKLRLHTDATQYTDDGHEWMAVSVLRKAGLSG